MPSFSLFDIIPLFKLISWSKLKLNFPGLFWLHRPSLPSPFPGHPEGCINPSHAHHIPPEDKQKKGDIKVGGSFKIILPGTQLPIQTKSVSSGWRYQDPHPRSRGNKSSVIKRLALTKYVFLWRHFTMASLRARRALALSANRFLTGLCTSCHWPLSLRGPGARPLSVDVTMILDHFLGKNACSPHFRCKFSISKSQNIILFQY